METLKANILKAISGEHESVYKFISACYEDMPLDESLESKMISSITQAMDCWADARLEMHKSLSNMIRRATERQASVVAGYGFYQSDAAWVTQTGYEQQITETNKWEQEMVTLCRLIGFDCEQRVSIFAKLTSLIKF